MSAPTAPAVRHGVELTTTDATETVAVTFQTETDKVYHVTGRVAAIETADHDEAAAYTVMGAFKNDGGTLTQIGSTGAIFTAENTGGWGVAFAVDGTIVQLKVTGAADTNIRWRCDLDILEES